MLTDIQKKDIIEKYKQELSMREIASQLNISINTVSRWIHRYGETGNLERKRGTGLHKRNKLVETIIAPNEIQQTVPIEEKKENTLSFS